MKMDKETKAELAKIHRQLMNLVLSQSEDENKRSIRRAAEAVRDAILDGQGA